MKKNWYAVYTRPKCEKKVAASLTKKRIECFCPMNRIIKTNSFDKKKLITEPLFPSLVFLNINHEEMQSVKQCNEVINFMYWLGKEMTFSEHEIDNIKDFSESNYNIISEKIKVTTSNNMIRIVTRNPLVQTEENVYVMNTVRIKLSLPSLGYQLIADNNEMMMDIDLKTENNAVFVS